MLLETVISASLVFAAAQAQTPDISLPAETLFPPDRCLVKVHALENAPFDRRAPTEVPFQIDQVYIGPGGLKGSTLSVGLSVLVIRSSPSSGSIGMPIVKGELAVFWVTWDGRRARLASRVSLRDNSKAGDAEREAAMMWTPGSAYVSRNFERGDVKYEMAITAAEVCEKVCHARDKERFKVIDDFVQSGNSVKGAAALALFMHAKTRNTGASPKEESGMEWGPKIVDYVLPLSREGAAAPRVQRMADKLLLANKEGWRDSPERWKIYRQWSAGGWKEKKDVPWDASEESAVVEALASRPRPYPLPRMLQLWLTGLTNPTRSERFKTEIVRQIEASAGGDPDGAKAFVELFGTIRADPALDKRVAAAKLLVAFIPFSTGERATLEQLSKRKLADEVRIEIGHALAHDDAAGGRKTPGKAEK